MDHDASAASLDEQLDLERELIKQELDRVAMPPPPARATRGKKGPTQPSRHEAGLNGLTAPVSPEQHPTKLEAPSPILTPAHQTSPFGPGGQTLTPTSQNSTRITTDSLPKPHFPSKALRRSSSSLALQGEPGSASASPFNISSFSATHANQFQPPAALTLHGALANGRASADANSAFRTIAVPTLHPMHLPSPATSPSDDRIPGIATRSRSMLVATDTPRSAGSVAGSSKIQRSFSTPGVHAGSSSATSSPPLGDSPSARVAIAHHGRHPSNSTSSVGPNVAGRIGVGGNVMVDPHGLGGGNKPGNSGAGSFVYKVYNVSLSPSLSLRRCGGIPASPDRPVKEEKGEQDREPEGHRSDRGQTPRGLYEGCRFPSQGVALGQRAASSHRIARPKLPCGQVDLSKREWRGVRNEGLKMIPSQ